MGNRRRMPPRMGSWQPERLRYGASAKGQRVADGLPGEKQPIQDRKRLFRRGEAPSCQNKSISVMRRLGLLCLVFAVTAAPVWARHGTAGCGTTATTPAEVLFLHRRDQRGRAPPAQPTVGGATARPVAAPPLPRRRRCCPCTAKPNAAAPRGSSLWRRPPLPPIGTSEI